MKQHYKTRHFEYDQPGVYHVINRIAFSEFRLSPAERDIMVRNLRKHALFSGIEILAFCVLSNHFHLLVRVCPFPADGICDAELMRRYRALYSDTDPVSPSRPRPKDLKKILHENEPQAHDLRKQLFARMHDLPVFMRELKQRFTRWYNRMNDSFGTVWAERYRCVLVQDAPQIMRIVAAYIEMNSVRAGLSDNPEDYRWCSMAAAAAGQNWIRRGIQHITGNPTWIEAHRIYRLHIFGVGVTGKGPGGLGIDPAKAQFVIQAKGDMPLNEQLKRRIRYFTDGAILGTSEYIKRFISDHKESFSKRKTKAGAPCSRPGPLEGIYALRRLQKDKEATD